MTTELRHGIVRDYDAGAHTATVQLTGSLGIWLPDLPVSQALAAGDMVAGSECAVALMDPSNPADAAVIAVYGGLPAGGGSSGELVYRRDLPEIILPTNAAAVAKTMNAANDVLSGVVTTIVSAVQFGANPLTLIGWIPSFRVGDNVAPGGVLRAGRQGRFLVYADTGAGMTYRNRQFRVGGQALGQNFATDGNATVFAFPANFFPIAPLALPANSIIGMDGAFMDQPTLFASRQTLNYVVAYDSSLIAANVHVLPHTWAAYYAGSVATLSTFSDYLTYAHPAAGVWVPGGYQELLFGGASGSPSKALITHVYFTGHDAATVNHAQYELAIGAPGAQVPQARYGIGMASTLVWGTYMWRLEPPVLIDVGERLWLNFKWASAAATNFLASAQLLGVP